MRRHSRRGADERQCIQLPALGLAGYGWSALTRAALAEGKPKDEQPSDPEFEDLDGLPSDLELEDFIDALVAMFRGESPDDEMFLDVFLKVFRADNGKAFRGFLKSLDKDKRGDSPLARKSAELAEVLIQHPALRDLVPH